MTNQEILQSISKTLLHHPSRLQHVLGVRDTAIRLGKKYHVDTNKLETAALLHDITKYNSEQKNIEMIEAYFPHHEELLREFNAPILHSFTAYIVAIKEFGIEDTEILNAILNHTVGKANMSMYEKIIFISDYIEPNRTYASCIAVRALAEESLDLAVYTAINDTIVYYEKEKGKIPKQAYQAREFYKRLLEVNHG